MSKLDRVANILVKRDGMSKNDARCLIESALSNARELIYKDKCDEAEDKFYKDTGLELDCLENLLI